MEGGKVIHASRCQSLAFYLWSMLARSVWPDNYWLQGQEQVSGGKVMIHISRCVSLGFVYDVENPTSLAWLYEPPAASTHHHYRDERDSFDLNAVSLKASSFIDLSSSD